MRRLWLMDRGRSLGRGAVRASESLKENEESLRENKNDSNVEDVRRCSLVCGDSIDCGRRPRNNGSYARGPE
jgi:hypothetical protein